MRFAIFLLLFSTLMATAQGIQVTDLRCEDLSAPVGVDLAQPKLGWKLQDAATRGQKQTAYRILVASTPSHLAADTGDLWDSGQVSSEQSLHVSYAGTWNAARDPLHFSGPGNLVVTSGGPPTPAEAWRFQHFSTYNNSGNSAHDADADNDGSTNLLERALGSNPKASDISGRPILNPGSPDFSFNYNRSKAATDLLIEIEVSPTLTTETWRKAAAADGTHTLTDDTQPHVQTWRFSATSRASQMFYRLSVRQQVE
jgi:hypothetical protein